MAMYMNRGEITSASATKLFDTYQAFRSVAADPSRPVIGLAEVGRTLCPFVCKNI